MNPSPRKDLTRGGEGKRRVVVAKMTVQPKFSLKLQKKETEDDFKVASGHRPPRQPKKWSSEKFYLLGNNLKPQNS
ncbi:hypothetical protein YC2023_098159 [Brassica napus]